MTRFINKMFTETQMETIEASQMEAEYLVWVEGDNIWTCIYEGDNYNRAKDTANFWDERVNTRLLEYANVLWQEKVVIEQKVQTYGFDPHQTFGQSLVKQFMAIEQNAEKALSKYS